MIVPTKSGQTTKPVAYCDHPNCHAFGPFGIPGTKGEKEHYCRKHLDEREGRK